MIFNLCENKNQCLKQTVFIPLHFLDNEKTNETIFWQKVMNIRYLLATVFLNLTSISLYLMKLYVTESCAIASSFICLIQRNGTKLF